MPSTKWLATFRAVLTHTRLLTRLRSCTQRLTISPFWNFTVQNSPRPELSSGKCCSKSRASPSGCLSVIGFPKTLTVSFCFTIPPAFHFWEYWRHKYRRHVAESFFHAFVCNFRHARRAFQVAASGIVENFRAAVDYRVGDFPVAEDDDYFCGHATPKMPVHARQPKVTQTRSKP